LTAFESGVEEPFSRTCIRRFGARGRVERSGGRRDGGIGGSKAAEESFMSSRASLMVNAACLN
jgi:hypothetical protein